MRSARITVASGQSGCPATRSPEAVYRAAEVMVARDYGVSQQELRSLTRGRAQAAFARQVAMYLAHTVLGLRMTTIARLAGRDRTTVAHACRLIERRRDDASLDARLCGFEAMFGAAATGARA